MTEAAKHTPTPDWIDGFLAACRLFSGQYAEYEAMRDAFLEARLRTALAQARKE